jgi:hypothetical protein
MTTQLYLRPSIRQLSFRLYDRPLHPELFEVLAHRRIRRAGFTLHLWLTNTGHAISWQNRRACLTEVTAADQQLPEYGQLLQRELRGERCDMLGAMPGVNYQVSFQVEVLPPDHFANVHHEILADGGKHGLLHFFAPNHRLALSPLGAVQIEAWDGCLSLSTFHTFPDECAVVKTQSLIEQRG